MPVTKTAKRALRSSNRKAANNKLILSRLEIAIRFAKREKSVKKINDAISLVDRVAKKRIIHRNKAARIKSGLIKMMSMKKTVKNVTKPKVKSAKKKKKSR